MQAMQYKERIQDAVPEGSSFQPLMTCYLTDATSPDDVYEAKDNGIVAYKLYPAGATTNSSSGVTNFQKVIPTLKAMADVSADRTAFTIHIVLCMCMQKLQHSFEGLYNATATPYC